MLVRQEDGGAAWTAIGQASHAWASGQLARAWGNDRFWRPAPFEAVCLAAEQHDVGMAEWDRAPALDPATGRALAFTAMPRPLHLGLWGAAAVKLETQSRHAALLVSMHGTALYTELRPDPDPPAEVRAFVDGQRAYQERLISALGADREEVERGRRLVFALDALSLALCLRWPPQDLPPVPLVDGGDPVRIRCVAQEDGATLDPWPFGRDVVEVEAEGRRLTERFEDEASLHTALAAAPSVPLRWTLRPATVAS